MGIAEKLFLSAPACCDRNSVTGYSFLGLCNNIAIEHFLN